MADESAVGGSQSIDLPIGETVKLFISHCVDRFKKTLMEENGGTYTCYFFVCLLARRFEAANSYSLFGMKNVSFFF